MLIFFRSVFWPQIFPVCSAVKGTDSTSVSTEKHDDKCVQQLAWGFSPPFSVIYTAGHIYFNMVKHIE